MKKLIYYVVALVLAVAPTALIAQSTYTIQPALCSSFPTNTVCGPAFATDDTDTAKEQVVLSFSTSSITLYQYDINGQNGTSVAVAPDGTFPGGKLSYSFYTTTTGGGKYGKRTRTYLIGTITKDASIAESARPLFRIPPPPPVGGFRNAYCGWTCAVPDDPNTYPSSPLNCTKSAAYNYMKSACADINTGEGSSCLLHTFWETTTGAPNTPTSLTCMEIDQTIDWVPTNGIDDETFPYCYPEDYWCPVH